MKIHIFYQKNEKGETKRPARWVVRQNSDETSDKFFTLTAGQKGSRAAAFNEAIAYVQSLGVTNLLQVKKGLWTSDPAEAPKSRTKVVNKPTFIQQPTLA